MVKPEINPEHFKYKPFSRWHRTLPNYCYTTDVDFLEWRNPRGIVAGLEVKQNAWPTDWQKKVFSELSKRAGLPFYFVNHDKGLTKFKVRTIDKRITRQLTKQEMRFFMEGL